MRSREIQAQSGWDAALACETNFETWTGVDDRLPMNCLAWYQAYAFCIWDGGFLPSEAEWNYAAAGGAEQRTYPWGSNAPAANADLAVYGCYFGGPSGVCNDVSSIAPVGSAPNGVARYGHLDLAGNLTEWVLDWHRTYGTTCNDCTNSSELLSERVTRGGDYYLVGAAAIRAAARGYSSPTFTGMVTGARCARPPTAPPATEICNGLDDNANGSIDEGDPGGGAACTVPGQTGVCTVGILHCFGGALGCVGNAQPGQNPDLCNGFDDDCNGSVDDGPAVLACIDTPPGAPYCNGFILHSVPAETPCNSTLGQCGSPGTDTACPGGCLIMTASCYGGCPGTETCNGVDDDCNGYIDDGNPGGGASCGVSAGVCTPGVTRCIGGALHCTGGVQPSPEICNGLDDDCNGIVDEGLTITSCCPWGNCGTGMCTAGSTQCSGGSPQCTGGVGPTTEICNGLDDDCNGTVDDGC